MATLAVLLLLLVGGCSGSDGGQAESAAAGGSVAEESVGDAGGAGGGGDGDGVAEGRSAGGSAGRGSGDGSALDVATAGAPQLAQVPSGDKIIKDGTIELEIAEGTFDTAFSRVLRAAEGLGGAVVSSQTTNTRDAAPSGSVTVRVPAGEYENLLLAVRDFGIVRARRISSQDVTSEYVDLRARLRQLQAQERFYLGLLADARDVEDAIAVQQQLQGLQTDIERIKGRLQYLDAKTTFSTLTVELYEPGAPRLLAEARAPELASYWRSAVEGLVTVVGVLLVGAVSTLPLVLLLLAALAAWRLARRRTASVAATAD